jgi:glycosyltransferase involved in cell wall biosynthesis
MQVTDLKISIITVCLNAAKTIRKTIESVANQTVLPFEYIIIDGGSTDGTLQIIKEYGTLITKIISEKDAGISDAFNKGIRLASGDVVGILNADDWYEPTTLQLVQKNSMKGDVFHGKIQYWRGGQKDYLAEGNHYLLEKEMTIHHPTVFVKKSVYDALGNFKLDYHYAMDYELMLRFYVHNIRFVYIEEVLANMSFDGASDKNWKKAIKESYRAKTENRLPITTSKTYYWKQLTRTFVARNFTKMGLKILLNIYRKNFSIIKKAS